MFYVFFTFNQNTTLWFQAKLPNELMNGLKNR